MRFAIFPVHLSKVLCLPGKVTPGHTKCCTCHTKSSSQNWRFDAPKMQPLTGNHRPDLLTSLILMNMSLALRLPQKMHFCRSTSNAPRLPTLLKLTQNPHVLLIFDKVHNPLRLPRETTSDRPEVVRACGVLMFLTCWLGNVLRATTAYTFATSQLPKGAPKLVWFDFEMCFAPQQHALFRHLNFQ